MLKFNTTTRRAATTWWQPGLVALAALLISHMSHAAARAGTLYVGQPNNSTIVTYDTSASMPTPTIFASAGVDNPQGLAFDSAGNLYAANNGDNTIEKFTPGGVGSVFATLPNAAFGLAFDSAGNLYASLFQINTIEKITPGGVGTVFANTGLNLPFGLAFDTAGNLYAANYGDNTIEKFTAGGVGSVFASSGLNLPNGLAFDSAGNLFAANLNSATIEKFTPGGVGSLFANTTVGPTALAFGPTISSVPEPSTLVLSSVGVLGLIGIKLVRRRLPILEKK